MADPVIQGTDDGFGPPSFLSPYDEQQRKLDIQRQYGQAIRDIATGIKTQADKSPRSFQSGGNEIMLNHNPGTLAALGPTVLGLEHAEQESAAQGALNTQKRNAFEADAEAAHSALLPQNYPQKQRIDPNTGKPQVINGQGVFEPDMDAAQRNMLHQARVMQSYGPAGAQLAQALQAKGAMLAEFHVAGAGQQIGTFNAAGPTGQQYQVAGNAPETVQGAPGSQTGVRQGANISAPGMTVPQPLTVGPADKLVMNNGGNVSGTGVQGATQWEQVPGAPGMLRDKWHPENIINQATQKPADPQQIDYITRKLPFVNSVRDQAASNPAISGYKNAVGTYDGMKQSALSPGHAGDAAMLSGFSEILGALHPRAGQLSAQEDALTANVAGKLQYYKSYLSQHEGRLSPELRTEMLDAVKPLVAIEQRLAAHEVQTYMGLAKHFDVDPGDVWQAAGVPPMSIAAPQSTTAPAPAATVSKPQKRRATDNNQPAAPAQGGAQKSLDEIFK